MIVYLIRNRINGKVYVGKTVGRLLARWSRHLYSARTGNRWTLCCAIRKYGSENFILTPLVENVETRIELNKIEKRFIATFNSNNPQFGYNMTDGGEDGSHTPESREKLRLAALGNKRGVGNKNALGNKASAEWRAKWKGVIRSPGTLFKRGQHVSPATEFKPQTHCKRGHEFTPENTAIQSRVGNKKRCRICYSAMRSRRNG